MESDPDWNREVPKDSHHYIYIYSDRFTSIHLQTCKQIERLSDFFTHTICPFSDETTLEAGIRVQIHSQNEPPYIHQLGFGVSPGFQTFVSCQEQRVGLTGVKPPKTFKV